jgi:kynurenine formamidase
MAKNNWGRWGDADERGTANLLTPAVVVAAAGLVRKGHVYPLAVPLEKEAPNWGPRPKPILATSWHDRDGRGGAEDLLVVNTHSATHLDALAHIWADSQMYNGYPVREHVSSNGATRNGIENAGGIVGRGVLLDLANHFGVEYLEGGFLIQPRDLEACAAAQGTPVRPGDIVLARTGWYRLFPVDRARFDREKPGLANASVEWLIERDVCGLGVDTSALSSLPPEPGVDTVINHVRFLRDHGGYLFEYLDLEALARDGAREFLFAAAPLPIRGGMGSPINPLAIT